LFQAPFDGVPIRLRGFFGGRFHGTKKQDHFVAQWSQLSAAPAFAPGGA
jgi:hypothetical protein